MACAIKPKIAIACQRSAADRAVFARAGGVACHLQAGYRISLARAMVYFLAPSCPEKISGLRLSEKKK
jgi:hypothetical protein